MSLLVAVYTTRAGQTSTHWAATLAWNLADHRRVLLVDCDMEGGTLADLMLLPTHGRSIANCFGDQPAEAAQLETQAIPHPSRPTLRVVPGLGSSYGYEISDCLKKTRLAMRDADADIVIADLGHPLSHPGLRSPHAAAQAICSTFGRAFVVIRDEPALVSRSIAVLRAAQPAHGELIICHQRGRQYRRAITESVARNVPGLAVRDVWHWDEHLAARFLETGIPPSMPRLGQTLALEPAPVS